MNEQNLTSQKLSKLLVNHGCKLESEKVWAKTQKDKLTDDVGGYYNIKKVCKWRLQDREGRVNSKKIISTYDILNDICVRYAKEFFLPRGNYERRSDVDFMVSRDEMTKGMSDCDVKGYAGDWSYTMGICPNFLDNRENCTCEKGLNEDTINRILEKYTKNILYLLQQNKKQEAEDYIWEHCLFNSKNK